MCLIGGLGFGRVFVGEFVGFASCLYIDVVAGVCV